MKTAKKTFTRADLKCFGCRKQLELLPDEDGLTAPPSFVAKLFKCKKCSPDPLWLEPYDFGIEGWDEVIDLTEEKPEDEEEEDDDEVEELEFNDYEERRDDDELDF